METVFLGLLQSHGLLVILGAFSIGALTSLAPCSIISVPLLVGSALGMSSHLTKSQRSRFSYIFALMFALGVTISFAILAYMVAKMGYFFSVAPLPAYLTAAVVSVLIGLYSLGVLPEIVDKSLLMKPLIKLRYIGALLIGILFGLVSTPCASAPIVAILAVVANAPEWYAYVLVSAFALGHSLVLLMAGLSVGFAQKIAENKKIALIMEWVTRLFSFALIGIGIYFFTLAYQQF